MPIRYYLRRKADGPNGGAVDPSDVDVELCELLGVKPHPEDYVKGWWDILGYVSVYEGGLASQKVRALLDHDVQMIQMLDYLDSKYVLESGR